MYEKFANWKNFPDESTPITAAALTHIEQGITDADITRDGTPAEVALSSRLSATAGSAEGLVQAERAAREAALALKADSAEMIDALGLKANASAVYTKAQSDTALGLKANSADVYTKNAVYTKGEVESGLSQKPNKTDVYTKAETGTQLTNAITTSRPILYGTGFPNGKVAAPVGTLYADEAVTNGASFWQKVVGTSTSGWIVVRGDSGSRNIADLLESNRVDFGVTKHFSVRRVSGWVALSFAATPLVGQGTAVFGALPNGFRPNVAAQVVTWQENADRVALASISAANCTLYFHKPGGRGGGEMMLYAAFPTSDDWPTMLPGTN